MTDMTSVPLEEQTGPPQNPEKLTDTNDLPEGFSLPSQTPLPDDSVYEEDNDGNS